MRINESLNALIGYLKINLENIKDCININDDGFLYITDENLIENSLSEMELDLEEIENRVGGYIESQ